MILGYTLKDIMYKDMNMKINNIELRSELNSALMFLIMSRRKSQ